MALRVTARRAQRLGAIAPNQTSGRSNNDKCAALSALNAKRCNAKWAVRATVPPAIVAWNCARVCSRCIRALRRQFSGVNRGAGPSPVALDGQALAALGAACVDDSAAATGLHAHQKAMGTGAARLGGLVSTFHLGSLRGFSSAALKRSPGQITLNTFRETKDYCRFITLRQ